MNQPSHYPRSLRLLDYDYAQAGAYFLALCTNQRRCHLGSIIEGSVQLALPGQIIQSVWDSLPERYPGIELDAMVIMPTHLHGVLLLPDAPSPSLGAIVRSFKAASTRLIRVAGCSSFAWQRNYYEHVIRQEGELARIRAYIANNPMQWLLDKENPDRKGR